VVVGAAEKWDFYFISTELASRAYVVTIKKQVGILPLVR
jgi:hypothetical protein